MITSRARVSACVVAVVAAAASACTGDARPAVPDNPPIVHLGTFGAAGGRLADLLSREPLVAVGWDGRPAYRLAESAAESPDGSVLTFQLRPNARFHTGEPVTPEQVRRLLMLKADLMKEASGIEITGERTFIIRLRQPHSLKLVNLSDYTIHDDSDLRLRTGPFKVSSLSPTATLDRFEQYYLGQPTVARVVIHEYPTHRAAWTAMMRGEVNFLHEVSRDAIDFLEAGGTIRAYPMLRPYYVPLVFNLKHPILRRKEVRVALSEAIDREEVVHNGMRGHGQVAEGPFWPYHWAYMQGRYAAAHNPEAARLRLEGAGLAVRRANPQAMPARFAFTCLIRQGDARFERIALVVQRQLFDIGVDMQLRLVPQGEFLRRIKAGDFESFIFEMASGRTLNFPYDFWHSKVSVLPIGYSAADEALDRMKYAKSDDEVRMAISEVMQILRSDPPAVFLASPREARAADQAFYVPYEKDSDVFGNLWQLRWRDGELVP
jgi:peptide/nickel transport system substrate-binding protein